MSEITVAQQALINHEFYIRAENLLMREQRTPDDVIDMLVEQGADRQFATEIVEDMDSQIHKAKKEKANKDMLYGALWCIGGIVATVADIGFIFYGAIIFGGIQFVRGLVNAS